MLLVECSVRLARLQQRQHTHHLVTNLLHVLVFELGKACNSQVILNSEQTVTEQDTR